MGAFVKVWLRAIIFSYGFKSFFGAQISNISPRYGGFQGGTSITITGSDFAHGNQDSSTLVYIGTNLCQTIGYYSNNEQIVCLTPKCNSAKCLQRQSDYQSISLVILSYTYNDIIMSGTFAYFDWLTPYIREIERPSGASGDVLTVYGYLRLKDITRFTPYVGSLLCNPGDGDDVELNGAVGDDPSTTMLCLLPENIAGYYNFSLMLSSDSSNGYGWSEPTIYGYSANYAANYYKDQYLTPYQVTPDGRTAFQVETYPTISSVNPARSSVLGGATVTITGSGFDANNPGSALVKLAGQNCTVLSVTATQIVCQTLPAGSCNGVKCQTPFSKTTIWPGGRGLKASVYLHVQNIWAKFNFAAARPDVHYLLDDDIFFGQTYQIGGLTASWNTISTSLNAYYTARLQAYFKPPMTAYYRFYVMSDDVGQLYLSTDQTEQNKKPLCSNAYYTTSYYTIPTQISSPLRLVAGEKYYFEATLAQGAGNDWINAGVEIVNASKADIPDGTLHQRYSSLPEFQTVQINSLLRREVQVVTLMGINSGLFFLKWGTAMSTKIAYNAAVSTIVTAVQSLQTCQSCTVTKVNRVKTHVNYTDYQITFGCPVSDPRTLLQVYSYSLDGPGNINFYVNRTQLPSRQLGGSISWGLNGKWSPQLAITTSYWSMQSTFDQLCRLLGNGIRIFVTGGSGYPTDGSQYNLVIYGMGNAPRIQVNTTLLTGSFLSVSVSTRNGSSNPFYQPIPAWFFETIQNRSQAEVWIGGMKASCRQGEQGMISTFNSSIQGGECPFLYSTSATPAVTLLYPQNGRIAFGSVLSLFGTGFNTNLTGNTVWLGNYSDLCNITSTSSTKIVCQITQHPP